MNELLVYIMFSSLSKGQVVMAQPRIEGSMIKPHSCVSDSTDSSARSTSHKMLFVRRV